ncbi:hypothetical protein DICA0_C08636 [Diutina catenulata]
MARKSSMGPIRPSSSKQVVVSGRPSTGSSAGFGVSAPEESVIIQLQSTNTRYLLQNQALIKEKQFLSNRLAESEHARTEQLHDLASLRKRVASLERELANRPTTSPAILDNLERMANQQLVEIARLRRDVPASPHRSLQITITSSSPVHRERSVLEAGSPRRGSQFLDVVTSPRHHNPSQPSPQSPCKAPQARRDSRPAPCTLPKFALSPQRLLGDDEVVSMEISANFHASTPKRQQTPPAELGSPQERVTDGASKPSPPIDIAKRQQILQSLTNTLPPPQEPAEAARRHPSRRTRPVSYAPIPLGAKLRRQSTKFVDAAAEDAFDIVVSKGNQRKRRRTESQTPVPSQKPRGNRPALANVTNTNQKSTKAVATPTPTVHDENDVFAFQSH